MTWFSTPTDFWSSPAWSPTPAIEPVWYSPEPVWYSPPVYTPPAFDYYSPPPFVYPDYGTPIYTPPAYYESPPYAPPAYYQPYEPPPYVPPPWTPPETPAYVAPTYFPEPVWYPTPTYYSPPTYDWSTPLAPSFVPPAYAPPAYAPPAYDPWTPPAYVNPDPVTSYVTNSYAASQENLGDPFGLLSPSNATTWDDYNKRQEQYFAAVPYAYSPSWAAGVAETANLPANQVAAMYPDYSYSSDVYTPTNQVAAMYPDYAADTVDSYFPQAVSSDVYQSTALRDELPAGYTPLPASPSGGSTQLANADILGGTESDAYSGNQLANAVNANINAVASTAPAIVSNESGTSRGVQIVPLEDGAMVTRPDGSAVKLDTEQYKRLLNGDNAVIDEASQATEKLGKGTTLISKDELSLKDPNAPRILGENENWLPDASNPNLEGKMIIDENGIPREVGYTAADVRKTPESRAQEEKARFERSMDFGSPQPIQAPAQDLGISDANMEEFQRNLEDIIKNKGGFTSQWQKVGSDRIMVQDDGSAIGINTETGETYALNNSQVGRMITQGLLNTGPSGYVAATGGKGNVPGGTAAAAKPNTPSGSGINAKVGSGGGGGGGGGGGDKKPAIDPLALLAALGAAGLGGLGDQKEGITIPGYDYNRTKNAVDTKRRAGSKAQEYFTGPGFVKKAEGGIAGLSTTPKLPSSLGGYSDGGRLLRGPGDGVSDSIPATIGKKQPARLADGEFVVPARIVSELGNGSTEAGARKLYAMLERVQKARNKTVGKGKVAANSRADKYLPA